MTGVELLEISLLQRGEVMQGVQGMSEKSYECSVREYSSV